MLSKSHVSMTFLNELSVRRYIANVDDASQLTMPLCVSILSNSITREADDISINGLLLQIKPSTIDTECVSLITTMGNVISRPMEPIAANFNWRKWGGYF